MSSNSQALSGAEAELAALDAQLHRIDIAGIHAAHRNSILPNYPLGLRLALSKKYVRTATPSRTVLTGEERKQAILDGRGVDSWAQANIDLTVDHERLKRAKAHLAYSDGTVRDMARQCADLCTTIVRGMPHESAYKTLEHYVARHGITMPELKPGRTLGSCIARVCDQKWWRRAIRSTYARQAEELERELGLVSRRTGLYASDDSVARRNEQRARNRSLLGAMLAVNELGECFTLEQLSETSVSSPRIRRAELMTRMRGFEELAKSRGDLGHFITLTLPSRFHRTLSASGEVNPKHDDSSVRDGHRYLSQQWARCRAYLDRHGVVAYGFRIAEPHHDGTPHWHVLLFVSPGHAQLANQALNRYFNPEGEPGDRRVNIKEIDPTKGSATGYIAKYVSKNIDGFGVGEDFETTGGTGALTGATGEHGTGERTGATGEVTRATRDAKESVTRVDAWASTHRIRQFQQIGGPPVSVWRELRRVRRPLAGVLEEARLAVEDQAWDRFCEVTGGVRCRAGDRPVRLHVGRSTKPGTYGEYLERQIKGVRAGELIVPTRLHTWTFMRAPDSALPWTRVNNCTSTGATRVGPIKHLCTGQPTGTSHIKSVVHACAPVPS